MGKRLLLLVLAGVILVGSGLAIMLLLSPPKPSGPPSPPPPVATPEVTAPPLATPPAGKPTLVISRETPGVSFLAVAWSPDGKRIAVAGVGTQVQGSGNDTDTYIAILDPKTLTETARLKGHSKLVTELAFVGNGDYLVSVSHDKTFRAWDVAKGRELASLPIETTGAYQMLAVSPDRQFVATLAARSKVQMWDVAKREMLPLVNVYAAQQRAIAVSNSGDLLATANETPLRNETRISVRLYDVEGGQQRALQSINKTEPAVPASPSCLAFSADASRLFCGRHNGVVEVWDTETSKVIATWRDHTAGVNTMAFSPDGRFAATAGGNDEGKDCDLRMWRVADGQLLGKVPGPKTPAGQLAWDPTGKLLTFGARDQQLRTWDVSALVK